MTGDWRADRIGDVQFLPGQQSKLGPEHDALRDAINDELDRLRSVF
ncbi:hypothetical protein [Streptomyces bauhiniae]